MTYASVQEPTIYFLDSPPLVPGLAGPGPSVSASVSAAECELGAAIDTTRIRRGEFDYKVIGVCGGSRSQDGPVQTTSTTQETLRNAEGLLGGFLNRVKRKGSSKSNARGTQGNSGPRSDIQRNSPTKRTKNNLSAAKGQRRNALEKSDPSGRSGGSVSSHVSQFEGYAFLSRRPASASLSSLCGFASDHDFSQHLQNQQKSYDVAERQKKTTYLTSEIYTRPPSPSVDLVSSSSGRPSMPPPSSTSTLPSTTALSTLPSLTHSRSPNSFLSAPLSLSNAMPSRRVSAALRKESGPEEGATLTSTSAAPTAAPSNSRESTTASFAATVPAGDNTNDHHSRNHNHTYNHRNNRNHSHTHNYKQSRHHNDLDRYKPHEMQGAANDLFSQDAKERYELAKGPHAQRKAHYIPDSPKAHPTIGTACENDKAERDSPFFFPAQHSSATTSPNETTYRGEALEADSKGPWSALNSLAPHVKATHINKPLHLNTTRRQRSSSRTSTGTGTKLIDERQVAPEGRFKASHTQADKSSVAYGGRDRRHRPLAVRSTTGPADFKPQPGNDFDWRRSEGEALPRTAFFLPRPSSAKQLPPTLGSFADDVADGASIGDDHRDIGEGTCEAPLRGWKPEFHTGEGPRTDRQDVVIEAEDPVENTPENEAQDQDGDQDNERDKAGSKETRELGEVREWTSAGIQRHSSAGEHVASAALVKRAVSNRPERFNCFCVAPSRFNVCYACNICTICNFCHCDSYPEAATAEEKLGARVHNHNVSQPQPQPQPQSQCHTQPRPQPLREDQTQSTSHTQVDGYCRGGVNEALRGVEQQMHLLVETWRDKKGQMMRETIHHTIQEMLASMRETLKSEIREVVRSLVGSPCPHLCQQSHHLLRAGPENRCEVLSPLPPIGEVSTGCDRAQSARCHRVYSPFLGPDAPSQSQAESVYLLATSQLDAERLQTTPEEIGADDGLESELSVAASATDNAAFTKTNMEKAARTTPGRVNDAERGWCDSLRPQPNGNLNANTTAVQRNIADHRRAEAEGDGEAEADGKAEAEVIAPAEVTSGGVLTKSESCHNFRLQTPTHIRVPETMDAGARCGTRCGCQAVLHSEADLTHGRETRPSFIRQDVLQLPGRDRESAPALGNRAFNMNDSLAFSEFLDSTQPPHCLQESQNFSSLISDITPFNMSATRFGNARSILASRPSHLSLQTAPITSQDDLVISESLSGKHSFRKPVSGLDGLSLSVSLTPLSRSPGGADLGNELCSFERARIGVEGQNELRNASFNRKDTSQLVMDTPRPALLE